MFYVAAASKNLAVTMRKHGQFCTIDIIATETITSILWPFFRTTQVRWYQKNFASSGFFDVPC